MINQKKAYMYAWITLIFWSTAASAFKISLRHMDFLFLLFYAAMTSVFLFFMILLAQRKIMLLCTYSTTDYIKSALLGFLNPFLYYLVLFKAYSILPAQEAQPLNYTWPIMLAILSAPLLGQKLRLKNFLAITISFLGVLIISTHGEPLKLKFTSCTGVSLALGSSIIWAFFWIYNVRDRRDEVAKLFLNFLFGLFYLLILFIILSKPVKVQGNWLLGAVYVGLFEMGITFFTWLKALKLSRTTSQVSNLIYLAPFFSLIIIRYAVGEHILISTITGLILIVSGIVIQRY